MRDGISLPVQFDCRDAILCVVDVSASFTPTFAIFYFALLREDGIQILGNVLTQELQHIGLVGGYVPSDSWTERKRDNARNASAELENGRRGREQGSGGKEIGRRGDPAGEEGCDFPDCCGGGVLVHAEG